MASYQKSMRAWKSNRVDQEARVFDDDIVTSFRECPPPWQRANGSNSGCWVLNRPLDMQVAQHIAFCMDYAFEPEDYRKFSKRNWDLLLDAMEQRWSADDAHQGSGPQERTTTPRSTDPTLGQ